MAHSSLDSYETPPAGSPGRLAPQVLRGLVTAMFVFALATAAQETEKQRHLPLPPLALGALAFLGFFVLFAITWSFRSIGTRH